MGRKIKSGVLYEEWEFGNWDELVEAAKKEAIVCGDRVDTYKDSKPPFIEIYNFHQGGARWCGTLVNKL